MLTLRSAHTYRPIVSPFLRAHTHVPPSLLQRHFHAGGPRLLETQHASTNDKAAHAPPPIHTVSEEVLKDKFEPGWAMNHARYTEEDLKNVKIVHKEREGWGDRIAALMVGVARTGFDIATRYPSHQQRFPRIKGSDTNIVKVGLPKIEQNHEKAVARAHGEQTQSSAKDLPEEMELGEMRRKHLCFGPEAWLVRIVFLESIAGVPGMVAASVRHLHSLRLLRRDKGWVATLLEEAANERQHLLVALKMYKPGRFMRTMLLLAQGVFYNFFFFFYLVAPRVAHRFVGILEEEAVLTYSRICDDIVEGRLPEWEHYPAPRIAIDYWGLKDDAKILDVMKSLRADEANHRYTNHTLAGLKDDDYNPFAYGDASPSTRGLTWGLTREEAIQYFEEEDAKRRQKKHVSTVHSDEQGPFQGRDGSPA